MKARVALGLAGALAVPLAACQILAGIEERYPADGGPDATAYDASGDVRHDRGRDAGALTDARADGLACQGVQPPPPPKKSSSTGESPVDFFVAVQSVFYDVTPDAGPPLGFNLDRTCTCEGKPKGPPSCVNDASANCDDDGGRDLAGNYLLAMIDGFGGSSVASVLNSKIQNGQVTLILRVGNYNLGEDDKDITIASFVGGGLLPADAGPDAAFLTPTWNGTDVWSIDPRSAAGESQIDGGWVYKPIFVDTSAYVTHHTIVSQLHSVELGVGQANLALTDAVLTATIEADGTTGGYALVGQIAGRLSVNTIFAIASTFSDPMTDGGQNYCGSDLIFQAAVRPVVCQSTDIMASVSEDGTGKGCDALSMSIGFVARKIQIGPPHETLQPVLGCDGSIANCSGL